eukprot:Platyproteum_vivax@DN17168_c0_g1_i1.p1
MADLKYWTGRCVLEFVTAEDILNFILVAKHFQSMVDGLCVKELLSQRFEETEFEIDAFRREVCDVKGNIHWLWLLEKNLALINKHNQSLIRLGDLPVLWARCGGTDTLFLAAALQTFLGLEVPMEYKIIAIAYHECEPGYILIVQSPHSKDTEVWTSSKLEDSYTPLAPIPLPVSCTHLKQIIVFDLVVYFLSEAGMLWLWQRFEAIDTVWTEVLEPVCKVSENK